MALRTTIVAESPDRTEKKYDRSSSRRGYWKASEVNGTFVYVPMGYLNEVQTHTIQTWYANTQAACEAFADAYVGAGSIEIEESSPVVRAYTLRLTETVYSTKWVDLEEPEE